MAEYMFYIIYASSLLFIMGFAGAMVLLTEKAPRRGP